MALPYGSLHNASCSAPWQIQWKFYYIIDDLDEIISLFNDNLIQLPPNCFLNQVRNLKYVFDNNNIFNFKSFFIFVTTWNKSLLACTFFLK
jgi:hypothetical protein